MDRYKCSMHTKLKQWNIKTNLIIMAKFPEI
jgi:hypothetical protein